MVKKVNSKAINKRKSKAVKTRPVKAAPVKTRSSQRSCATSSSSTSNTSSTSVDSVADESDVSDESDDSDESDNDAPDNGANNSNNCNSKFYGRFKPPNAPPASLAPEVFEVMQVSYDSIMKILCNFGGDLAYSHKYMNICRLPRHCKNPQRTVQQRCHVCKKKATACCSTCSMWTFPHALYVCRREECMDKHGEKMPFKELLKP